MPYLGMWISSILLSMMADKFISTNKFTITTTRKILNSIGQFSPALCLAAVSYTGCNRYLTVFLLTVGISLNGAIYSGFKINHLDISPRYAGILMSLTNASANLAGLLAPITAGHLIHGKVSASFICFLMHHLTIKLIYSPLSLNGVSFFSLHRPFTQFVQFST